MVLRCLRMRRACAVLFAITVILASAPRAQQPGVAYLAIDLATGRTLTIERPDRIDVPILPGSVMKIAVLAAALESGTLEEGSTIACRRRIDVAGHTLTCTHPDFQRPLKPAEALAHSCNVFFATVANRLPRAAFDRALADLGLPPSDRAQPLAASALGLEGARIAPRRILESVVRISAEPSRLPWRADTRRVVRDGMLGAARDGTAAVFAERGIDAMVKTGTVIGASGLSQGVVVGVTPASSPTTGFVLLGAGVAGRDAAMLAADRLEASRPTGSASPQRSPSAPSAPPTVTAPVVHVGVARPNGGYDLRTVALDDYVAGVVAKEAAPASSPVALEALAITVRTFALANRGRHAADGFDLCDLTHCQVLGAATAASARAATATSGRVLLDNGAPAAVFYTASCGGHSERPSNVWRGATDSAFLPAREDDACRGEPRWSADLSVGDVMRALRAGGFRGDLLREIRVGRRTAAGRIGQLVLDGFVPREVSGETFRTLIGRTLGWQHVRSTLFDIRRTGAGFHLRGHGAGHGVGLCVIGSSRLANRGETAAAILARYFPGTSIGAWQPAAPSRVVVTLPASERHETVDVVRTAERTLDDLASALALVPPSRITLRFHPTVESYERETRQRWYTTAVTRGTDIQFLPLTVLRERGVLERTIRHELVHVLTAQSFAGRPRWIVEGAALYFAGEGAPPKQSGACPADRDFSRAASRDALESAYERAAACFGARVRGGVAWRDVMN